jgi:formylmethanofuran dehydrogenase subunit C
MQYSLDLTQEVVEKINGYSSYLDQRTIEELKVTNDTLKRKLSDLEADIIKLKNEKENLKIRLLLAEKTNIDKAQFIINDSERPIYFYSKEIEQIIEDKLVDKNTLIKLHNLFKVEENQHNKTLKIKLMNEINNR